MNKYYLADDVVCHHPGEDVVRDRYLDELVVGEVEEVEDELVVGEVEEVEDELVVGEVEEVEEVEVVEEVE
ncbi:hypothetical protein MRX96_043696 [Rhipicephalus microplus]